MFFQRRKAPGSGRRADKVKLASPLLRRLDYVRQHFSPEVALVTMEMIRILYRDTAETSQAYVVTADAMTDLRAAQWWRVPESNPTPREALDLLWARMYVLDFSDEELARLYRIGLGPWRRFSSAPTGAEPYVVWLAQQVNQVFKHPPKPPGAPHWAFDPAVPAHVAREAQRGRSHGIRQLYLNFAGIVDWATATRPDISRVTWTQAIARQRRWHATMSEGNRGLEPGLVPVPAGLRLKGDDPIPLSAGWTVHPLLTVPALKAEGAAMSHCISGDAYAQRLLRGSNHFFSVRDAQGRARVTLDVFKDPVPSVRGTEHLTLLQAKGPGNRPVGLTKALGARLAQESNASWEAEVAALRKTLERARSSTVSWGEIQHTQEALDALDVPHGRILDTVGLRLLAVLKAEGVDPLTLRKKS